VAGGYRDIRLSLEAPDGQTTELQVNVKSMIAADEGPGHRLYEQFRSISEKPQKTPQDIQQMDTLEDQMKQVYNTAWERASK
jgi:hypothetical protein